MTTLKTTFWQHTCSPLRHRCSTHVHLSMDKCINQYTPVALAYSCHLKFLLSIFACRHTVLTVSNFKFDPVLQATIGFGSRVVGVCGASAVVLTFQNVFGMILDAVSLGVIFAKLSHPKHRGRSIFISECATIARRDGQLKFMIRIADIRCAATFFCVHPSCTAHIVLMLVTYIPAEASFRSVEDSPNHDAA